MRKPQVVAALVAATFAVLAVPAAFAEEPKMSGAITTEPGKGKAVSLVKATATVESINPATREVVLKMPKGDSHTIVAGDEVRNFDQIKVGDKVHVRYMEALTVELKKDGKDVVGRRETSSTTRAAAGEKPGGIASREVTVVADVVGVDPKKNLVQVKNEHGEVVDLHLNDPAQVKLVKKGDQVQATYTEAFAVALEPVAPAKKKK
ncbi:MAG TPA: hypothetical protein VFE23_18790 [Usitatibacter sp.]|jgi:hypothetical protein|nr:hypothetical protein [Usitatibacter sp.]